MNIYAFNFSVFLLKVIYLWENLNKIFFLYLKWKQLNGIIASATTDLHFLLWCSKASLVTWSERLAKSPYQKNTSLVVRLEPAIYRLEVRAFINRAILTSNYQLKPLIQVSKWTRNSSGWLKRPPWLFKFEWLWVRKLNSEIAQIIM